MKRLTITLFILATLLLNMLPACDGLDDHYSTNPTYRLSFSTDTLAFDTIFSTIGSTTRQFMIYNKNSEPLSIESIMLASGESTGFRMNVDGRKGSSFNNVGILANDSMYVFVEVTVDPNGGNQPLLIQDSVLFTVNGIRQSVLLEAYGQDVNLYKGGVTITKDSILTANRPYLIYDSLVIAKGVSLNIEKGATFYMHDKASLIVHGSMNALGTLDGIDYSAAADLTGQANHLGVTIKADIIKQKLPENNGGFTAINFGKIDQKMYTELTTEHPIDLCRYQVANNYMGRVGLINSGGESHGASDLKDAVVTAVINKRAGGMGLISGRKAFQRPMKDGVELLHSIQDIYLDKDITIA